MTVSASFDREPLDDLKLLAHDVRWKLICYLARSDYRVHELGDLIREPMNLVSYHLKKLRMADLVHEHRSLADGRDVYYSLDLDKVRGSLLAAGESIHPAVVPNGNKLPEQAERSIVKPTSVLFLCTHNSARSQMAEGILRQIGNDKVEVFSAGSEPAEVHRDAIRVMAEMNIDISQQRSKHLNEFAGQIFDYIITVCDRVREVCPVFPGDPKQMHWSLSDPAAVEGNRARYQAFLETANLLSTRLHHLLIIIERGQAGTL
jgi:ArsR family transcriptional regulator, arsenate/arsenite/antimonite-responsive transcriptional repressor / arsenate reductase (thioredoxin)